MERVRIPSDMNEEDVFFSMGPIKLSIRQLLLVFGTGMVWYLVAKYFVSGVFGITIVFAMLATSWLLVIGLSLAFVKVAQRPLDVWIGEKLGFIMSARTYVMRSPESSKGIEADLAFDEDMQAMLDHRRRGR